MRRPGFIARQSSCPSGWLGRVIARIMARETTVENALALRLLDPRPQDVVLEIGFGHGRVIAELASHCSQGSVRGLDSSPTIVQMATRLNQATVDRGLVQLDTGDSSALPYASDMFDCVLTVHTIYFWSQPLDHLREVLRVLKPGGKGLQARLREIPERIPGVGLQVPVAGTDTRPALCNWPQTY